MLPFNWKSIHQESTATFEMKIGSLNWKIYESGIQLEANCHVVCLTFDLFLGQHSNHLSPIDISAMHTIISIITTHIHDGCVAYTPKSYKRKAQNIIKRIVK